MRTPDQGLMATQGVDAEEALRMLGLLEEEFCRYLGELEEAAN